jgi:hypothetical protein
VLYEIPYFNPKTGSYALIPVDAPSWEEAKQVVAGELDVTPDGVAQPRENGARPNGDGRPARAEPAAHSAR